MPLMPGVGLVPEGSEDPGTVVRVPEVDELEDEVVLLGHGTEPVPEQFEPANWPSITQPKGVQLLVKWSSP